MCCNRDDSTYFCRSCLFNNLPLLNVEDEEFTQEVGFNFLNGRFIELNEKRFNLNPFSNLDDKLIKNNDLDVDENYFDCLAGQNLGYMDSDQLNARLMNVENHTVLQSIMHINARSLISNIDSFHSNLKLLKLKISVICVSETWTDLHTEKFIGIPG